MKKVAIITRTKDREVMLRRAAESVCSQTLQDFVWVVVNDGGDPDRVDHVVNAYRDRLPQVLVIHNPKNLGMEAASNVGIRGSSSDYVVIHDDDDTWSEQFLEKTVEFLEGPGGENFGGVITESVRVDETFIDNVTVVRKRTPWKTDYSPYPSGAVQIAEMAVINQFAPIAFLYRRSVLSEIGLYNEALPVLGDWDFNLRFMRKYEIGVISEALSNYHHRISTSAGSAYGNSVVAGLDRHAVYDAHIRNGYVRESLRDTSLTGFAVLLASGKQVLTSRNNNARTNRIADFIYFRTRNACFSVLRLLRLK